MRLRIPPPLLIEARWCVETVNVFPWISVVGRALIDSDLTALHALSYSETIAFAPPLLFFSFSQPLLINCCAFRVLAYTSSWWRWMVHVSRANCMRLAIMSSYYFILMSMQLVIQSHAPPFILPHLRIVRRLRKLHSFKLTPEQKPENCRFKTFPFLLIRSPHLKPDISHMCGFSGKLEARLGNIHSGNL